MNHDQLNMLCKLLDLGKPQALPSKVHGGLLHHMWQVVTDKGTYAIKQLSKNIDLTEGTRKQYETTECIAKEFQKQGIPVISSLTKNGRSLVDAGNSTFIVYPWVDAKMMESGAIHSLHASKIATLLAQMHHLNLQIPGITEPIYEVHSSEKIRALIEEALKKQLPFAQELEQNKSLLLNINAKYHQAIPLLRTTLVISHGDLDPKNVLWDDQNNPMLIDWESARLLNPTQEIVNAALDWSGVTTGSVNTEIFNGMLAAYKQAGGIIDTQVLEAAFYGIQGNWINWLVYNLQRSLNTAVTVEEQQLGVEQVTQTLRISMYLESWHRT